MYFRSWMLNLTNIFALQIRKSNICSTTKSQERNYDTVKEWYDGYRFRNVDMYCPWDVVCYCKAHKSNKNLLPQNID